MNKFVAIKERLCNAPFLQSYDTRLKSVLTTDASEQGLGAVLQQKGPHGMKTIMFLSRGLRDPETRYSVVERESLAVYWAVKKLKKFLWGVDFEIRTDHKPLVELFF